MKKNLPLVGGVKLLSTIFLFTLLMIWLNGCKKNDSSPPVKKDVQTTRDIPDWVKEKFRSTPRGIVFSVDKTKETPADLIDRNGNLVYSGSTGQRLLTMPCDDADPSWVDNSFGFDSEQIEYQCDEFRVKSKLRLTTGFTIVLNDPTPSAAVSRIRLYIRNSSSTIIYDQEFPISLSDITSVGTVPGNSDLTIYELSFVSPWISSPVTTPAGLTFQYRPTIYTNCPDAAITLYGRGNLSSYPNLDYSDVCNRIDIVDIESGGMGNPGYAYFDGSNSMFWCSYPSGFVPPQQHQIEWKKVGDATYGSYQPLLFANYCTSPATINLPSWGNSAASFPVNGDLTFRFRNLKRSSSNDCTSALLCSGSLWYEKVVHIY